jgi:hypothetical protein
MTDTFNVPSPVPDIEAALPELTPTLRTANIQGWAIIAGLAAIAILSLLNMWDPDGEMRDWLVFVGIFAVVMIPSVFKWVRRKHEAAIMPLLSRAAGLSYQQGARSFLDGLPDRLLPKASRRTCEDLLSGRIGDRAIQFGEVKIETGGKNSSTLFQGVVMTFPNLIEMPAFFVASERQTRGWFVFSGNIRVDDLIKVQGLTGRAGTEYGVWSTSPEAARKPGFEAVLKVLTSLEAILDWKAELYTASSDGRQMHVAISNKRDLFVIGGLLAPKGELLNHIRAAYHDLTLPMKIVSALLGAEAEVAKAAAPATA